MAPTQSPLEFAAQWRAVQQRWMRRGAASLTADLDTRVGTTPSDVVYEEDRMKLMRYRPVVEKPLPIPLLIVYALVNRQYMLDLQPDRSVVKHLLNLGLDVYLIDWGYPAGCDRFLTLGDYVNGYLHDCVEYVKKRTGQPKINLMGVCQGGTFAAMYASLNPRSVGNLATLVAPIDFDTQDGLLHVWSKSLDAGRMVDTFGNIPGDFMNVGFLLMNPIRLMFHKYVDFLEHLDDQDFLSNFIRMEKWIFDSPDQAGEAWRQFMQDCYQRNLLVKGEMELDGRRIDLRRIDMPVLNVFAEHDHLVPPAASRPFTELTSSQDAEVLGFPTGHIGLFVGRKSHAELWPRVGGWIVKRSRRPDFFLDPGPVND